MKVNIVLPLAGLFVFVNCAPDPNTKITVEGSKSVDEPQIQTTSKEISPTKAKVNVSKLNQASTTQLCSHPFS